MQSFPQGKQCWTGSCVCHMEAGPLCVCVKGLCRMQCWVLGRYYAVLLCCPHARVGFFCHMTHVPSGSVKSTTHVPSCCWLQRPLSKPCLTLTSPHSSPKRFPLPALQQFPLHIMQVVIPAWYSGDIAQDVPHMDPPDTNQMVPAVVTDNSGSCQLTVPKGICRLCRIWC